MTPAEHEAQADRVRVIERVTVRFVERLPERTVRDSVAWTVDMLPSS